MAPLVLVPGVGARIGDRWLRLGTPRETVWRELGEPEAGYGGRELIGGVAVDYEGGDSRVCMLAASEEAILEIGSAVIDPFAPADDVLATLMRIAPLDDTEYERGYSYTFPALELALWRSARPEDDPDAQTFQSATIGALGTMSTGASVRAALRDRRRHPPQQQPSWAEWHLIWPEKLGVDDFQRFARDLRDVPLPGMSLSLIGLRPASAYLAALEGIGSVRSLNLAVTAADRLPELPDLQRLQVTHVEYGPRLVADIAQSRGLRALTLTGDRLDDAAFASFAQLSNLRTLDVNGATITGDSAGVLAQLRALEEVNLFQTSVDDRACDALATLPNLRSATLYQTRVTEAGARRLAASPSLRFLNVAATEVPARIANDLQSAIRARRRGVA